MKALREVLYFYKTKDKKQKILNFVCKMLKFPHKRSYVLQELLLNLLSNSEQNIKKSFKK